MSVIDTQLHYEYHGTTFVMQTEPSRMARRANNTRTAMTTSISTPTKPPKLSIEIIPPPGPSRNPPTQHDVAELPSQSTSFTPQSFSPAFAMADTLYISQRAANAIIADVAPYRISSEALLAINSFLDEFLYFLIEAAHSLDLVRVKMAVGAVLPTSLGKNAVGEAELELKTYVESGSGDRSKERTIEISPFPLQKVFEQFRVMCQSCSTLGERGVDGRDHDEVPDLYASEGIHIAPSLAIYLTAILEYVGERILLSVARMSERNRVDVAKLKEVYAALAEDQQVVPLFRRTKLREQLETVNGFSSPHLGSARTSLSTSGYTAGSPVSPTSDYSKSPRKVSASGPDSMSRSQSYSPVSSPTQNGYNGLGSKRMSTDKGMRSTKSMNSLQDDPDFRIGPIVEDSREKMKNFESLIANPTATMKVSLTPNRLVTIESHKKPPKLAPREPVSRERVLSPTTKSPTGPADMELDDDPDLEYPGQKRKKKEKEESLYEFLKNSSPNDMEFGRAPVKRQNSTNRDLLKRREKSIDKLEAISERPKSPQTVPTSPGQKYAPLIPPSLTLNPYEPKIDPNKPRVDPSKSRSPREAPLSYLSAPSAGTDYYQNKQASRSAGHIESTDTALQNTRRKPDPLDLEDDEDPRSKRRHTNQDLLDFLATTPPSEITTFSAAARETASLPNGPKKEKKLMKFFMRLRKTALPEDQTLLANGQQPANATFNSFSTTSTYVSNTVGSTSTQKARYVKIEIPQVPVEPEKTEPSIFDQVEIQGRHARHLSKNGPMGPRQSIQALNKLSSGEVRQNSYDDERVDGTKMATLGQGTSVENGFATVKSESGTTKLHNGAVPSVKQDDARSSSSPPATRTPAAQREPAVAPPQPPPTSKPPSSPPTRQRDPTSTSIPPPSTSKQPSLPQESVAPAVQRIPTTMPVAPPPTIKPPPPPPPSTRQEPVSTARREKPATVPTPTPPISKPPPPPPSTRQEPVSTARQEKPATVPTPTPPTSKRSLPSKPPTPVQQRPQQPLQKPVEQPPQQAHRRPLPSPPSASSTATATNDTTDVTSEPTDVTAEPTEVTVTTEELRKLRTRVARSPSIDDAAKVLDHFVQEVVIASRKRAVAEVDAEERAEEADESTEGSTIVDANEGVDVDEQADASADEKVRKDAKEEIVFGEQEALVVEWLLGSSFSFEQIVSFAEDDDLDDDPSVRQVSEDEDVSEDDEEEFVEAVELAA